MNGAHQVFAYVHDVNLIGDDITVKRNADKLLNSYKDVGLSVNIRKKESTWK